MRLYRIKRLIEGLSFKFPNAVFVISCIQLLIALSLMAHWLGCLWFSIGYTQGGWLQLVRKYCQLSCAHLSLPATAIDMLLLYQCL